MNLNGTFRSKTALLGAVMGAALMTTQVAQAALSVGKMQLKAHNGKYVQAVNNGGSGVQVVGANPLSWETFEVLKVNDKAGLNHNDQVFLKTGSGHYLVAECGGGTTVANSGCGLMNANRTNPLGWETFTVVKVDTSKGNAIVNGDKVGLKANNGRFCQAMNGGGGAVSCATTNFLGWEHFSVSGLPTTQNPTPTPTPAPTPIPGDALSPQSWVKGLKFGMNIERGAAWSLSDFASGTNGYNYLKSIGITHVRLFYPWRPSINMGGSNGTDVAPTDDQFRRILPSVHNANKVGLKVILDLTDVLGTEDFEGNRSAMVDDFVDRASKILAAEKFDKNMVAFGPVNEYAGGASGSQWGEGNNPTYNAIRKRLDGIMRKHLPGYIMITGPAYWKFYTQLWASDFEMSDDPLMMYDVHAYDWNVADSGHRAWVQSELNKWMEKTGKVVIFGEAGLGNTNPEDVGSWDPAIRAYFDYHMNTYPMFWAINQGSHWRMNQNTGTHVLHSNLESTIKSLMGK